MQNTRFLVPLADCFRRSQIYRPHGIATIGTRHGGYWHTARRLLAHGNTAAIGIWWGNYRHTGTRLLAHGGAAIGTRQGGYWHTPGRLLAHDRATIGTRKGGYWHTTGRLLAHGTTAIDTRWGGYWHRNTAIGTRQGSYWHTARQLLTHVTAIDTRADDVPQRSRWGTAIDTRDGHWHTGRPLTNGTAIDTRDDDVPQRSRWGTCRSRDWSRCRARCSRSYTGWPSSGCRTRRTCRASSPAAARCGTPGWTRTRTTSRTTEQHHTAARCGTHGRAHRVTHHWARSTPQRICTRNQPIRSR